MTIALSSDTTAGGLPDGPRTCPAGYRQSYPAIERNPPPFDVPALQRLLDGEYSEIRTSIKTLLSQPEFAYPEAPDLARYRATVLHWTRQVAATGLGRTFMPASVGGEQNLPKFIAAFETFGYHDLSLLIKLGVQFGLFAGSIQRLGTEYHHMKYLPAAATTELLGCFAMTEIGHGSNVQGLKTSAVFQAETDGFIVHTPSFSAGKNYIGNAGEHARLATVFAQLEVQGQHHGVHAFLVPIRDAAGRPLPGITIADNGLKMGLNGVDNGRLWFDRVHVPRREMLNRFAEVSPDGNYRSAIKNPGVRFFTMIGTLVSGRISIAASANSVAKSALTIAIRYGARRRQFGPPTAREETLLLDFPAHQMKLMPLLANAYALDFALKRMVRLNETAGPDQTREIETSAAALKAFATWNTTATVQACREACGGEGYLAVNRLAALRADTDIFTTFEGDNTVLMQLVAKNLLTELSGKVKGMPRLRRAAWLAQEQLTVLAPRQTLLKFHAGTAHLLHSSVQAMYLRLRERCLLLRHASAFQRLMAREKLDAYTAFLRLQPELLELAHAFVARTIQETFIEAIAPLENRPLQSALKRLADLFAVGHLYEQRAWYLENGVFSRRKSEALGRLQQRLCREVRGEAVALTDAFGIPDACLAAPIAL
ncbi:MAG TPA: acyl-CoA dehydrogenase [Chthoniobacterales bacterium]